MYCTETDYQENAYNFGLRILQTVLHLDSMTAGHRPWRSGASWRTRLLGRTQKFPHFYLSVSSSKVITTATRPPKFIWQSRRSQPQSNRAIASGHQRICAKQRRDHGRRYHRQKCKTASLPRRLAESNAWMFPIRIATRNSASTGHPKATPSFAIRSNKGCCLF